MIKNKDTYCTVQHKIVRELGAWEAVVYGTIVNLLRKTDGIGEVSNQTIIDLCGITNKMSLKRYIDKLIKSGYLEKRSGYGRGNISIYYITKKGNNLLPFSEKKGNKNDAERVTKMNEKGNNLLPINKGINKELKESDGVLRATQPTTLSNTTTNFENMEDFYLFCELYPVDPEWSHEKEACERVWTVMSQEWRNKLIDQLKAGLRWRVRANDNPYWYLKNYEGQDVQAELPFVKNGSAKIAQWSQDGKQICVMMYDGGVIYCLAENRETMEVAGAKYLRDF